MSDSIRRLMNVAHRAVDRRTMRRAQSFGPFDLPAAGPSTARAIVLAGVKLALRHDDGARLASIAAPDGVDSGGRADRWSLCFDLPRRRARLECDWLLADVAWRTDDGVEGGTDQGWLQAEVIPFPEPGSTEGIMLRSGRMSERNIPELWNQELSRRLAIPVDAPDSDTAIHRMQEDGLVVGDERVPFGTDRSEDGTGVWVATGADRDYTVTVSQPSRLREAG